MESKIKPGEFRIGNIFLLGKDMERIFKMEFNRYGYMPNGVPIEDFEPIPLTPELLEKCGFELDYAPQLPEVIKGNFVMNFMGINDNSDNIELSRNYSGTASYHLDVCIKYLHQLQNLYFSLTSTELKIEI